MVRSPIAQSCATCAYAMKTLSSPIRVRPPPPCVPRWIVTNSRKTLRWPITRRVSSPLNFRSCGINPIDAKGKTRHPSPSSVVPSITAAAPMSHRAPIRTSAPITAFEPTTVPAPMTAPGATRADGAISGTSSVNPIRRSASATAVSPTAATPRATACSGSRLASVTVRVRRSPGNTCRRNFALSTPRSTARTVGASRSPSNRSSVATWTSDSIIMTPGMVGAPGKCPWKYSSFTVTFLTATSRFPGSCSTTASTSKEG